MTGTNVRAVRLDLSETRDDTAIAKIVVYPKGPNVSMNVHHRQAGQISRLANFNSQVKVTSETSAKVVCLNFKRIQLRPTVKFHLKLLKYMSKIDLQLKVVYYSKEVAGIYSKDPIAIHLKLSCQNLLMKRHYII